MSPEERTQSINQLRSKCVSPNSRVPQEEVEAFLKYPMTQKELELRASLQILYFDKLSADVLQSHFTYFYQKGRIITKLTEAATDDNSKGQLDCKAQANKLLVDEIGKSLQRKGAQPQVPPAAAQQKV